LAEPEPSVTTRPDSPPKTVPRLAVGENVLDCVLEIAWILYSDSVDTDCARHRREVRIVKRGSSLEEAGSLHLQCDEAQDT
jgi:hypothetical protein